MKTIYKFPLMWTSLGIRLPVDAVVVHVAEQANKPVMWVMIDTESPKILRTFELVGTGHEIDPEGDGFERRQVGTILQAEFVWHVLEVMNNEARM